MIKNVIIPKHIYQGILPNHVAYPGRLRIFGFDTETVKGEPYTFQISADGEHADVVFCDGNTILDKFLEYIEPKLAPGHINVMYVHNLAFDLAVLLKKYQKLFIGNTKLRMKYRGVKFDFVIAKVHFGKIKFPGKKVLQVMDSYAFFTGSGKSSLEALAVQLDLPYKKIGRMADIGERRYRPGSKDYKNFVEYARQDAIVEWHLGRWICAQYEKFDTRLCVSAPQFSMRVFRHYHLHKGDCIKFPPPQAVRGCLLSYHGGKNGYYVKGVNVVKKCYEIDVVSMYPFALKSMPNFLKGNYEYRGRFDPEYEGVWCITGTVKACKYPCIFSHDFKPLSGDIENIWVSSYELKTALDYEEIELKSCHGYIWVPDPAETRNPFGEFVDYFFKLKDTAKSPTEKLLAKIILNSLYGKMIQTIESEDGTIKTAAQLKKDTEYKAKYIYDADKGAFIENKGGNIFQAGGMFNPFIATLITGFARAYLHRLEHKYKALHSSTDSVKTVMPCVEDKRLGGIKIECVGKCILFRNKLYLHYNQAGELKKYALHGFIGRPEQLLKLFKQKKNVYRTKHMYKVREAFKQGKTPLKMEIVRRELKGVDFSKVNYINS